MYLKVLEREGSHQALYSTLTEYITNRKHVAKLSGILELNDRSFRPYFSVRYIANLLNISQTTAINLIRELNRRGVIRTTFDGAEFMCRCGQGCVRYLDDSFDYKYVDSGALHRVRPSRHEFLTNPIPAQPMTLRRYKRLIKDQKIRNFVDRVNLTLTN